MVSRLPGDLSTFVGRAAELASVTQALREHRLVTLAGPGGCGKTRLAIQAARQVHEDAVWVDLSEDTRDDQVVERVAEALAVPVPHADPAALVATLADGPAMVVLDNCEQVRAGTAAFVAVALSRCPELTVLATSREPLGVAGERVWRLTPMVLTEAVDLLLERAGAPPDDDEARAAARGICDRLDRLPLALELTASWAGTLSLREIADMLHEDADHPLLDGGARRSPFRQRSLADSMDWSHRLLTADERVLLRRLAPFQQFGADAVRAMGDGLLPALRGLVDKSLVVCDVTGQRARYRMLTVVAEYALARLREAGEETTARHRHAQVQLSLLRALEPLAANDKDRWRDRVREFRADLHTAAEWCLSGGDPTLGRELCVAAAWWWHLTSDRAGRELLRRAADLASDDGLQAKVLVSLALVGEVVGPDADTFAAAERAVALSEDRGTRLLAQQLTAIGLLDRDLDAARDLALRTHREATDDPFSRDASGLLVGLVDQLADQHTSAREWLERSASALLSRGDRGIATTGLAALATGQANTGDLSAAEETARRAREAAAPLHDFVRSGTAAWTLARVVAQRGRTTEAEAVLDELQRMIDEASAPPYVPGWFATRAQVALWRGDVAAAVTWCERERHAFTPDLLLTHAAALRKAGDPDGARERLEAAVASPTLDAMPLLRATALAERAEQLSPTDPVEAAGLHRDALRIRHEHGLVLGCVDSLEALAALAGTPDRAGLLFGAAVRAREETGYLAARPTVEGDLARGRALTLDQAVDRVLRVRRLASRPVTGWASLTPAERSVAELAVRGLSNPQIAAELFIGRGTVKTHLARAYAKLGVANRTELAHASAEETRPMP